MKSNTKTVLSPEMIARIMKTHFGTELQVLTVTELTEGWFNAVYIVSFSKPVAGNFQEVVLKTGVESGKYVLTYEKDLMRAELKVYELLSPTKVPVPRILVKDLSRSLLDCDYFIMEKLQGDNWGKLDSRITPENNEKLISQVAGYMAEFHNISQGYFGYVKEDPAFRHTSWRSAFSSMVHMTIADGRKNAVALDYAAVLSAFSPLWELLDEVKEPALVNFDMWKKNIMLREVQGEYKIDGIIDHERAFFGDPCAEFIAANTICTDVSSCTNFQAHYSAVSGKPFLYTKHHHIRLQMYQIYLTLLMGTEVYRYDEKDTADMLDMCSMRLKKYLEVLKQLC